MRQSPGWWLMAALFSLLAGGIAAAQQPGGHMQIGMHADTSAMGMRVERAVAVLYPTQGNEAHGTVTFERAGNGVHVIADLAGLKPGNHGFHVHMYGDCTAPDAASAGDHFSMPGQQHGAPTEPQRHLGDLGNVVAGADGTGHLEWTDPELKLDGPHSIIGRAIVLHANPDDLKTQPSGNSGPRVACGVIGVAGMPGMEKK